jgi:hypothetical protein
MIACESMMSKGYGSLVLNFLRIVGGLCDRGGGNTFWTSGLHIGWKKESDSFSLVEIPQSTQRTKKKVVYIGFLKTSVSCFKF